MSEPNQVCINGVAKASAKLLDFSIRARQRAFDPIAATQLAPAEKQELIVRSAQRVQRARQKLDRHLMAVCSEENFLEAYNRDADSSLGEIGAQASCNGQYVYVQDGRALPPDCVSQRNP